LLSVFPGSTDRLQAVDPVNADSKHYDDTLPGPQVHDTNGRVPAGSPVVFIVSPANPERRMNYTESGPHGTIGEESQRLVAVARGDEDPDTIVENGTLVNVHTGELQAGMALVVAAGRIARVVPTDEAADLAGAETTVIDAEGRYMAPGFLDTHEHIESSMVTVTGFAKGVLPRGTTGVFMDPHEIGNVLGLEGIRWMLNEAEHVPLKVWCAVSSCVPAAPGFEDAGAVIDSDDVAEAMDWPEVVGLGEMMDFPGVIRGDGEVHEKLAATYEAGQVATGHFSLLSTDEQLDAFIASGISSCHESVTREGALERLRRGLWTMLRQGSAWKDVPETIKAVTERSIDTRHLLLVTDDIHPGTIVDTGHLDEVVRVAIVPRFLQIVLDQLSLFVGQLSP